jgi:hypothetical protein
MKKNEKKRKKKREICIYFPLTEREFDKYKLKCETFFYLINNITLVTNHFIYYFLALEQRDHI